VKTIRDLVLALPEEPGVYRFLDERGKVLYVGKARSLRSRVRAYLGDDDARVLIAFLRREARDLDFLVTRSEAEALILENSLIKKNRPRYNIRLRDDKNFLNLRLDLREKFPWFTWTRRVRKDGALYFGPYASAYGVRETLRFLTSVVPLRTCSEHVFRNRSRPCVYHQIGRCEAPCVGLIAEGAYRERVDEAMLFLKGKRSDLVERLRHRMWREAESLRYEEAARLRDQIGAVERTIEAGKALTASVVDRDVFAIVRDGERLGVEGLFLREGRLVGTRSDAFRTPQEPAEALASFLVQFYEGGAEVPPEILVSEEPEDLETLRSVLSARRGAQVSVRVPERGDGRRLVETARHNATLKLRERGDRAERDLRLLEGVQERLALKRVPVWIECFDLSHTSGGESVGSSVAFRGGRPWKDGYRRYRIQEAAGGDDFAMMREILTRRFRPDRVEEEGVPDLLLIDGGAGQVTAAMEALGAAGVAGRVDVVGLAKGRMAEGRWVARKARTEKLHVPGREHPVVLPKGGVELRFLDRVRDEAHRFAITYHRKLRGKAALASPLGEVAGVGPGVTRRLLRRFRDGEELRAASVDELRARAGVSSKVAEAIWRHLHASDEKGSGPFSVAEKGPDPFSS
jgi:excinuclease ABC subunit C